MLLYTLGIKLYNSGAKMIAPFNEKAKLYSKGRENLFENLSQKVKPTDKNVWFHVSSLGEFEQGRPVMEKFKEQNPDYKIILTFFSPSGYEVRKNYKGADYVGYIPADTPKNAKKFLDIVNPKAVFFVKYDFWYNFLNEVHSRNIPLYIFSTIFRESQVFFKWYGGKYKKVLGFFTHLFVQDENSVKLLAKNGITNVTIAGDTRFDRVCQITQNAENIPLVDKFVENSRVIVAGSSWPPDEDMIFAALENLKNKHDIKLIIAPHEIHEGHLSSIEKSLNFKHIRFSKADETSIQEYEVLIIDNFGMLSRLYKYAEIAYVGGGFGAGIHNILEAVSYGIPVVFGTNYKRFKEAVDLVSLGSAATIRNKEELSSVLDRYLSDKALLERAGKISEGYVKKNLGAADIILKEVNTL
ncbi:MAG: 3-deoxy-D-manno-octulosonic acid transferase [Bacteroidales bacterium]|nr:3-deoxy-D-manno-octulosonic acid transferase [Bacteroidales bacterium]